MKIQILISKRSWANKYKLQIRKYLNKYSNTINFFESYKNLKKGYDVNIIFSYFTKIPKKYLLYSRNNLVPHESKLPRGKGMSPLTWQILEKKDKIFFSLIEANNKIDGGSIYYQKPVKIRKYLIFQEIKEIQLFENLKLIKKFIIHLKKKNSAPKFLKKGGKSSYYKKRNPLDSELNINDTLKNQFNLLRISDYSNYPAFFKIFGKKFKIKISRL